ncbi:hypothetical protein [Sphingobacterium lactis]|uniref:hypothetical protein n=1 Tax=Sphingobacterium lactis TaxID=797291 RepID=UPI003DA42080
MTKTRTTTEEDDQKKPTETHQDNDQVESDTGKRPESDTNPLPPNPNKVDDHEE